ncbi:hypothetical protein ACVV8E_22005, partial [Enterobacter hormaechei]
KRAYYLKTQPATGETYPKSDLFNKAQQIRKIRLPTQRLVLRLHSAQMIQELKMVNRMLKLKDFLS